MIDDLLLEFVAETKENLAAVDVQLVRLESVPDDAAVLADIFRLVHTIKGSSGFVGLPRLGNVAHAAENVLGAVRDGQLQASPQLVSAILRTLDRIRAIIASIEEYGVEPQASDDDIIATLSDMSEIRASEEKPYIFSDARQNNADIMKSEIAPEIHGGFISPNQTVRVPVKVLDHLMDLVSELVLTRNQLVQIVGLSADTNFEGPIQRLSQCTTQLQEGLMRTRLQPIAQAWSQLPRIVRDLSFDLNKRVSLHLSGEETGLDRQVMELIKDPLIHMVRNAVDHGIELPAARIAVGKSETGKIYLNASQEGGFIFIRMRDDGRGLQENKLIQKALLLGLVAETDVSTMSRSQAQKLIFLPGMTTTDKATTVSGRGVGMDVVKSNIERIGGTIEIDSTEHKGCEFTIKIPLTLAIISALLVEVGGHRFAFPQSATLELLRIAEDSDYQIHHVQNSKTLKWRDELVTLADLRETLELGPDDAMRAESFVILTRIDQRTIGIIVDNVLDTQEIVVKPLAPITNSSGLYSGAAILGDGKVIIILNPDGVAEKAKLGSTSTHHDLIEQIIAAKPKETASQMLLVSSGAGTLMAVPLEAVTRIDEIEGHRVELANGRPVVQMGDLVVPLIPIDASTKIQGEASIPLILFTHHTMVFGLVIGKIIDIFGEEITVQSTNIGNGIIGTAVMNGHVTNIIDLAYYFTKAYSPAQAHSMAHTTIVSDKPTILIIDESPFFRTLMRPLLQSAGYEIIVTASLEEAQKIAAHHPTFDIILSDIDGLDAEGIEQLAAFRESAVASPSRLIALSLSENGLGRLASHRGQFDDWAVKMDSMGVLDTLTRQLQAGNRRASR
jgi:two-component system, chemotaxis family, sensor kinase CheA